MHSIALLYTQLLHRQTVFRIYKSIIVFSYSLLNYYILKLYIALHSIAVLCTLLLHWSFHLACCRQNVTQSRWFSSPGRPCRNFWPPNDFAQAVERCCICCAWTLQRHAVKVYFWKVIPPWHTMKKLFYARVYDRPPIYCMHPRNLFSMTACTFNGKKL